METGIRDFCVKYNEKLKNDKDIKENQVDVFRGRISFNVNMYTIFPSSPLSFGHNGQNLFTLDAEDLEYLYKKYSKKIETEMEQNIEKIKDSYKDALLNGVQRISAWRRLGFEIQMFKLSTNVK